MRLEIYLEPESAELVLPIHYNYVVQSAIYSLLDLAQAEFLHNVGFSAGGRVFKGFTFSRLMGQFSLQPQAGAIVFTGRLRLVISSPIKGFCDALATRLLVGGGVRLHSSSVRTVSVTASEPKVQSESIAVRTLSPVVSYSTMQKADGSRYTVYYQPGEPEFARLASANLIKKAQALAGLTSIAGEATVRPVEQLRMSIIDYKGTVIKGYSGRLGLQGPSVLLQMALDAGLGSKNSQGFGCLEYAPEGGSHANREPDKAWKASGGWRQQRG
ncbi:MAG: CRISPR-associated endoribonuclease Cas6 [Clostridia bacterium]|nr:CRISPR-associated endoribonuclease Cas6 [Clostridia bacterium]